MGKPGIFNTLRRLINVYSPEEIKEFWVSPEPTAYLAKDIKDIDIPTGVLNPHYFYIMSGQNSFTTDYRKAVKKKSPKAKAKPKPKQKPSGTAKPKAKATAKASLSLEGNTAGKSKKRRTHYTHIDQICLRFFPTWQRILRPVYWKPHLRVYNGRSYCSAQHTTRTSSNLTHIHRLAQLLK